MCHTPFDGLQCRRKICHYALSNIDNWLNKMMIHNFEVTIMVNELVNDLYSN